MFMYLGSCFLACALTGSFLLHAMQITHEHYTVVHHESDSHAHEQALQSIGEYMHMSDKKLFVYTVPVLFVLPIYANALVQFFWVVITRYRVNIPNYRKHFSSFLDLYHSGILNPKLF